MAQTLSPLHRPAPADVRRPTPGEVSKRHRFQLLEIGHEQPLRYYAWRHPEPAPGNPWLCAVHGISRDAREQMRLLLPAADAAGWSLVAPRFDKLRYPRYQRLAGEQGRLPHEALLTLIEHVQHTLELSPTVDLFGFSGGAQFAHRFAMLAPAQIRRLAVAAAGWYTLPDGTQRFPYGTERAERYALPPFEMTQFAAVPQLVLVGSRDVKRDSNLRQKPHLDTAQGRNRVERAVCWYQAIRRLAIEHRHDPRMHRLRLLPGVGHDFAECVTAGGLSQHLFDFLTSGEDQ